MTPTDFDHEIDDLTFFTRVPDPTPRRSCMIAIADRNTRRLLAIHLEKLGYDVWTSPSGLDAYRTCVQDHADPEVLVCDEHLPDLPPLVLFNKLRTQFPALQCCVVANVTRRESAEDYEHMFDPIVLDVVGWRSGMLFVNATMPANLGEKSGLR